MRVSRRSTLAWAAAAPFALRGDRALAESLDDVRFTGWGREAVTYLDLPPYYLSRDELRALPLSPPPLNSSPATRAELDALVRLEASRSAAETESIQRHLDYVPICMHFVNGDGRNFAAMPRTRALLEHIQLDIRWAVFQAKNRFCRPRPDRLDSRIHPCIPVPPHPAYPSSHAALGCLLGRVVSVLAREGNDSLVALGFLMGREREVAGVHYPSDSVAGRALAEAVFLRFESSATYVSELQAAKTEWASRR